MGRGSVCTQAANKPRIHTHSHILDTLTQIFKTKYITENINN